MSDEQTGKDSWEPTAAQLAKLREEVKQSEADIKLRSDHLERMVLKTYEKVTRIEASWCRMEKFFEGEGSRLGAVSRLDRLEDRAQMNSREIDALRNDFVDDGKRRDQKTWGLAVASYTALVATILAFISIMVQRALIK